MSMMRASLIVSADATQVVGAMRQAEGALDGVSKGAARLGGDMQRAGAASRTAVRDLVEATTGVGRAMSSAERSADVFSRALTEQEAQFKALRAAIDPAWRAEQQFSAAQKELNRALRAGLTDARTHGEMVGRLEQQYEAARAAALKLDNAQSAVGRGSREVRGQIQNVSLQIGDLATQIGAGTAASVALGQQLPQLLGGFGAHGAAAGAVVAIGVPLTSAFLGAGNAAKEAETALSNLDTALGAVSDRMAIVSDKRLEDTFGSMAGSVRELSAALLELDRGAQFKALGDSLDATVDKTIGRGSLGFWSRPIWNNQEQTAMLERANYAQLTGGRGLAFDDFQTRRQEIDLLARTGQVEEVAERVQQLIRDMADGGPVTALNAELGKMLGTMGDTAIRVAEVEASFNGSAEAAAAYRDVLDQATARHDDLARLAAVRTEAEQRLGAAITARDAAAAATARAVIAETDRQITATTDAEGRVSALEKAFGELETTAGRVAFDRDAALRGNVTLVRDLVAEARRNVADLDDEDLSGLEEAMRSVAEWAGILADETAAAAGSLTRAQVSGYQGYAASRRAGAMIASTDAVSATRAMIERYEGYAPVAKWDENANRGGWGSSTITLPDGSRRSLAAGEAVNKADADRDLDRRIRGYLDEQQRIIGAAWAGFTADQVAAVASIQHNYGSIPQRIQPALQTGDAQIIAQAIAGLAMDYTKSEREQGKTGRPMNYNRRMGEAAAFGDPIGVREANDAAIAAQEEGARQRKQDADRRAREMKTRADQDQRVRDGVTAELDKLTPSYERAVAAADRWKAQALAGLDKTKAGYEAFAADIEAVYQKQIAKAREDDLARQGAWAAGIERGFAELSDSAMSWADLSENLITGWAKGGEDAFASFVTTGKASLEDLVDFSLEQLARFAWQQAIQPGLNGLLQSAANALGGALGAGAASTGVTLPTAHTGGTGVMRTYSAGNRKRSDERLAMLRNGERVMTPRMLENAGALVSSLAGLAGRGGDQPVVDARPVVQVINQSSAPVTGEVKETRDERGGRQYQLVLSDAVAGALTVPGGRAAQVLRQRYSVTTRGPRR